MNANEAWTKLFEKYDIANQIKAHDYFIIKAEQIKEFKEPRLMAKWDSSESLPKIFKEHQVNILPISRSAYILGKFELYQKLPDFLPENPQQMHRVELPEFESISLDAITSEAVATKVLTLSNILDDFLDEDDNVATFDGRMGTGQFKFFVNTVGKHLLQIEVNNAQCEIDAGLENAHSVVIIEAKNVLHPDFHVRQLYFPYRLWQERVRKPIRLVFSIYSNQIFKLLEYRFTDHLNYSSIELVREKNYSLQDTEISNRDLWETAQQTQVKYKDDQQEAKELKSPPFPQANSMPRVISLLEVLARGPLSLEEIAEIMQFDKRQSDYYFNAGSYLGLFVKQEFTDDESSEVDSTSEPMIKEVNNPVNSAMPVEPAESAKSIKPTKQIKVKVCLTPLGKQLYAMKYKARQLALVSLILQHQVFFELFIHTYETGSLPDLELIEEKLLKLARYNRTTCHRRASSVREWVRWIFSLTEYQQINDSGVFLRTPITN